MKRLLVPLTVCAIHLAPHFAAADGAAFIVIESDYRRLDDVPGTAQAEALARKLEATGFRVTASYDQDAPDVWDAVARFRGDAESADRVFVFLSGHFVATARDSYLLTRFAESPTNVSVGGMALPVGPILDIAAAHPGQAMVMLARSGEDITGAGLISDATVDAPQGVTLASGPLSGLIQFANDTVLVPGQTAPSYLPRGVSLSGFVSPAVPLLPAEDGADTPAADPEAAFWAVVQEMNSVEGFGAYLDRYASGRFADAARAGIVAIEGDAERIATDGEAALGLSRDARREIQRNLSLLGFDPRGIDGIFGPGSRGAIEGWQRREGFEVTGYLTAEQLTRLTTQAGIRAAELEEEARLRKQEQDRLDAAYWTETGKAGDEAGLRTYLERYPDGLYAEVARARLEVIEQAQRAEAQAAERALWDQVREQDSAEAYAQYLNTYPEGAFAEAAQARLNELTAEAGMADEIAAAQEEERRVAGNRVASLLVEQRLDSLGFEPGRVDGDFDDDTRKAIRQFQRTRNLSATGYVTQATMVHLLAAR